MKKIVRIGSIGDQDKWRRDDLRKMSPDERVALLLQMQNRYIPGYGKSFKKTFKIKRMA